MQELRMDELELVDGAGVIVVIAAIAVLGAIGVGIYNGYQDAKKENQKK